jgi:hypothetical protein
MASNHRRTDADELDIPKKSDKGLILREKIKVLNLMKKDTNQIC